MDIETPNKGRTTSSATMPITSSSRLTASQWKTPAKRSDPA
ncbi:hypothetical protein [Aneurinibacillus tyrosinisolvens]|nr:hypothetical protein [Aneurinibacillus tyrosinisolvens]